MKRILLIPAAVVLTMFLATCKGTDNKLPHVAGLLDEPLAADSAPAHVLEVMEKAERFHQSEIMSDTLNDISVEAIGEADTTSTEGYGIVVVKGATSTTFPNLRNAHYNQAAYDKESNTLWLTCCVMWGTGVNVHRLYQIGFDDNNKAYITHTIDPYDLQQQLCQRLGYSIEGEQITLYDNDRLIATVTNTVTDMGGFDDEQPLWIGEQMGYDLSGGTPYLLITPGVKYTTGLVVIYDDTPTLKAPLSLADDGTVSIGNLECIKE